METPAVVFIVDDNAESRRHSRQFLDGAGMIVEDFPSVDRFLARQIDDPELVACLLVDLGIHGLGGFGLQELLNRKRIAIPIVFLSELSDVAIAVHALQAGAIDYLQKPVQGTMLVERVQRALGIAWSWRKDRILQTDFQSRLSKLSSQERRVCALLVEGFCSKEIATQLEIGLPTVTKHRARVLRKFGVRNPVELAKLAIRYGHEACTPLPHIAPVANSPLRAGEATP